MAIALARNREKSAIGLDDIPADLLPKVLSRIGAKSKEELKFIEPGSQGTVYQLPDNRAFKITQDASEARAAHQVMENPDPNLYRIQDVFQIGNSAGLYGLLMDFLQPADPEWERFGDLFNAWHTRAEFALEGKTGKHVRLWLLPPLMGIFKKYLEGRHGTSRFKDQLVWLEQIIQYLYDNKILFLDIHGKNIMKDPGTGKHVLIDLGYSQPPDVKLDVVAAFQENLMIAQKLIIMAEMLLQNEQQS